MCVGDQVYVCTMTTAAALDRSGLTTWTVQAARRRWSSVHTAAGQFITVITVMMCQSCAATVSTTTVTNVHNARLFASLMSNVSHHI